MFEILEYETDLEFERTKIILELMESELLDGIAMEGTVEKKGFFQTLIEKIQSIITTIQKKISEFFSSVTTKDKLDKAEKAIKENPELAKTKVKLNDYNELDELNRTTLREISQATTSDRIAEKMIKYKKQRNSILAKGTVVVISLGAALVLVTKNKNDKIKSLNEQKESVEASLRKMESRYNKMKEKGQSTINDLKAINKELQDKLELAQAKSAKKKMTVKASQLKRNISNNIGETQDQVTTMKQKANAQIEILQNASKDVLNSVADTVKACASPGKNIIDKVKEVKDIPTQVVNTVTDSKKTTEKGQKTALKTEILELQSRMSTAKEMINSDNPKITPERKEKAEKFLKANAKKLHDMKVAYSALKK